MNLRDFEYLVSLARLQHFGKAAIACNVSQPTLSMQIKKLEETLGVTLFERNGHALSPTPAGQAIITKAEMILQEIKAIREIARYAHDPMTGALTLGAFPTLAPFLLPKIVPSLNKKYPQLKLFLKEEKTSELLKQLRAGAVDIALMATPIDADDLEHMVILKELFLVAVSKNNPLSRQKKIQLNDLREENLLLLDDSHCLTGQALQVCTWTAGVQNNSFRATSLETLQQMVASNLGVTFVPRMATGIKIPALVYLPLDAKNQPHREIGLFWRKSSPFATTFRQIAKKMGEILEG